MAAARCPRGRRLPHLPLLPQLRLPWLAGLVRTLRRWTIPAYLLVPLLVLMTLLMPMLPAQAALSVTDDSGHVVTLTAPAGRIVSLAPHATELLFAAGAGTKLVGVSQYSNYPPEAARIASVGGAATLDLERIVGLKPDLVVAWASGSSASQLARLRALGIPVFESDPHDVDTVAASLERLSALAGTGPIGQPAATRLRTALATLRQRYAARPVIGVFFQVWQAPLMTLNDAHIVSSALRTCGARNVFGSLPQLAPTVSTEAVLQADPEVILTSGSEQDDPLKGWRRFSAMRAVRAGNLIVLQGDTMTRAGPRIVEATRMLCERLDAARQRLH